MCLCFPPLCLLMAGLLNSSLATACLPACGCFGPPHYSLACLTSKKFALQPACLPACLPACGCFGRTCWGMEGGDDDC